MSHSLPELVYEIDIEASAPVVFAHLVEADGLCRWMAVTAEAVAEPGGVLTWTHENGAVMRGRFVEVDPPRRVVFRYGWEHDLMGVGPESTTVEVVLTPIPNGTHVHLTHRDLPGDSAPAHRHGWNHFLTGLRSRLG